MVYAVCLGLIASQGNVKCCENVLTILAAITVVIVTPHTLRTYIVSRDIAINEFYPTWHLGIDDLAITTGEKVSYCI